VKTQARTIYESLCEVNPEAGGFYRANLDSFSAALDSLSGEIGATLEKVPVKTILVFHPAWGYFANQFGLVQIPIEIEGKEPTPGELAAIISYARKEHIRVIFVQPQFSMRTAEVIAGEINGTVVAIDPLAENYVENLKQAAEAISRTIR
jgi:zinc transport system substrate-binding protein